MTPPGEGSPPSAGSRPRLAAHARIQTDRISEEKLLLYPEGALRLNATGGAILALVDGRRTVQEIAAELAAAFGAPRDRLLPDIAVYLSRLGEKGLVSWEEPA